MKKKAIISLCLFGFIGTYSLLSDCISHVAFGFVWGWLMGEYFFQLRMALSMEQILERGRNGESDDTKAD